jgi:hypothetical protein
VSDNTDLIAFVRARLDEEARLARDAGGDVWWTPKDLPGEVHGRSGVIAFSLKSERYDAHIARQDPADTLRRVAASRVVVDEYAQIAELDTDTAAYDHTSVRAIGLGFAVRQMAAQYPSHADYRARWMPRFIR